MNQAVPLFALWLATTTTLFAQAPPARVAPTRAEFALQLPLAVSGNNGVVQLRLPKEVYLQAQCAELADLRIFNGAGELLPYAYFQPERPRRDPTQIRFREDPATLFPVRAAATSGARDLELEVRAAPDGSLLSISAQRAETVASASELAALVVDLGPSAANETLEGLRLVLPEATSDYRATLAIERSDDLKLWDAVAQSAVDWLSGSDNQRLVNDRIEIPRSFGRYLRIRWLEGEPLVFAQVTARWRSAQSGAERAVDDPVYEVRLVAQAGRVAGDFVYLTSPGIDAGEIGLNLPQPNTVIPVSIGFYRDLPGSNPAWRFEPRVDNTFYRLIQNGAERVSSRLAIAPLAASAWVVRAHAEGPPLALPGPELVLRWKPSTLAFTARGGDFVLVIGAAPAQERGFSGGVTTMDRVAPGFGIDELGTLEAAVPGAALPAPPAVSAAVRAAPPPAVDTRQQRKILLWSVLILGVLVLAYMSWRLFAQLGNGQPKS